MLTSKRKITSEARCIYINNTLWQQAQELAKENALSVSSYIRLLIKQQCQNENKNRCELAGNKKPAYGAGLEGNLINSTT